MPPILSPAAYLKRHVRYYTGLLNIGLESIFLSNSKRARLDLSQESIAAI